MLLSDRFKNALTMTFKLHRRQFRKGTRIPYVAHLLAVTSIILENGGSENEAIAGLLHDAIEDQARDGKTREEIRSKFGEAVLKTVEECTDGAAHPRDGTLGNWKLRKEEYLAHIPDATGSACLVSGADKIHNLQSILRDLVANGEELWGRFTGGKDGTVWYYCELAKAFRKSGKLPGLMMEELDSLVGELNSMLGA